MTYEELVQRNKEYRSKNISVKKEDLHAYRFTINPPWGYVKQYDFASWDEDTVLDLFETWLELNHIQIEDFTFFQFEDGTFRCGHALQPMVILRDEGKPWK